MWCERLEGSEVELGECARIYTVGGRRERALDLADWRGIGTDYREALGVV